MNKVEMKEAIRRAAVGEMREIEPGTVARTYRFAPEFPGFGGHFPDFPILPAVAQLLAALCLVEDWGVRPLRLLAVEHAKFLLQLRPQQEIVVQCREHRKDGRQLLDCRLWREEQLAASFSLVVADREAGSC
jgi:3-hydroxyacyl-[acyl-carrier-protein] dehydratase